MISKVHLTILTFSMFDVGLVPKTLSQRNLSGSFKSSQWLPATGQRETHDGGHCLARAPLPTSSRTDLAVPGAQRSIKRSTRAAHNRAHRPRGRLRPGHWAQSALGRNPKLPGTGATRKPCQTVLRFPGTKIQPRPAEDCLGVFKTP